jgi:hypothetical protein
MPIIHLQQGDLLHRLNKNYGRLEQEDYLPAQLFQRDAAGGWPGDTVGRTLLAWASLAGVTGRAPKYLHTTLIELPRYLNEQGYMGPVCNTLDEQTLSGHGWLVSGLIESYRLTGEQALLDRAQQMVDALFMRMHGQMPTYPSNPHDRIVQGHAAGNRVNTINGWTISSDTGCAFISLEGLVKAHALFRRPTEQALIDELFDAFCQIDLLGISAQLHASLTATRQFLSYYQIAPRPAILVRARQVYGWFREQAMTENYANYNWFNRPTWTEPCAIVDAFIVALELWQITGEAHYLDDAHHIYYNALGYAQKPHGGFGLENCLGAHSSEAAGEDDPSVLYNKEYDVWWCCNMRGAVGLAEAARHTFLHDAPGADERITMPFFFNASAEFAFASGSLRLSEATDYPFSGQVKLVIDACSTPQPVTLRLHLPGWAETSSADIQVNGQPITFQVRAGFAQFTSSLHTGDVIHYTFDIVERHEPLLVSAHVPGQQSLRRGPLIIGQTQNGEWLPLNNVIDLDETTARTERRRVLFPIEKCL